MKLIFKYSVKGLSRPTTSYHKGERYNFKEKNEPFDVPDDFGESLLIRFPYNFIDARKVAKSAVEEAPDKMVTEDKPATKAKGKSK
jgi:hypothetical protein